MAFRKKMYESVEELQIDLERFMDFYNYERTHQGYKLKKNDYDTPVKAHLSGRKKELTEVGSCEITNMIKKEVLVCDFVTTS